MTPYHFYQATKQTPDHTVPSGSLVSEARKSHFGKSGKGQPQRGFTLIIAVIISSVSLALALTLLDISYKQVTLALTAKQSQYAFAYADSALECALYWDQKFDSFNFNDRAPAGEVECATGDVTAYDNDDSVTVAGKVFHVVKYDVPCVGGGTSARVSVLKASDAETYIYANGYNTCAVTDGRRIERGLKAHY